MEIKKKIWSIIEGNQAELIILKSTNEDKLDFEISFTNIGASIVNFKIQNKNGELLDILYKKDNPEDYFFNEDKSYMGSIVGRVASLVSFGHFEIKEDEINKEYKLSKNLFGVHHMHGGFFGLNRKIWNVTECNISDKNEANITFSIISKDNEEGYPGNLNISVNYQVKIFSNEKKLEFSYRILTKPDKTTIINIINHAYWNLNGIFNSIDEMEIKLNSKQYIKINYFKFIIQTLISKLRIKKYFKLFPIEIKNCNENGLNFENPMKFKDIFKIFGDLDTNFLLENYDNYEKPAELKLTDLIYVGFLSSKKSGLKMELYTTEPSITIFSGNNMKSFNKKCKKHFGVCLETMKPPNAINIPQFANWIKFKPNENYLHYTKFIFTIEK